MKAKLLIVSPAGRRWPRSLSSREGPHREGMCRHRQSSCYAHVASIRTSMHSNTDGTRKKHLEYFSMYSKPMRVHRSSDPAQLRSAQIRLTGGAPMTQYAVFYRHKSSTALDAKAIQGACSS